MAADHSTCPSGSFHCENNLDEGGGSHVYCSMHDGCTFSALMEAFNGTLADISECSPEGVGDDSSAPVIGMQGMTAVATIVSGILGSLVLA